MAGGRDPGGWRGAGGDAGGAEEAEGAGDGVADGGEGLVRGGGAAAVLPEHDITDLVHVG
jgi:hypothetical protein